MTAPTYNLDALERRARDAATLGYMLHVDSAELLAVIADLRAAHAPPRPVTVTAEVLARSFAIAFRRLRELERPDPAGAANLRATIAAEVRRWHELDAVPLEVSHG